MKLRGIGYTARHGLAVAHLPVGNRRRVAQRARGLDNSLGGAGSATATFTVPRRRDMTDRGALDDGNWIDFQLTVTDGDGESASDTVRLTIRGTTWQEIFASVADAEAEESVVTLDTAGRDPLSVDWTTSDGTATAGTDFTAASGTLTFAAGETSKTVSVTLLDDAIDEGKETFALQLSNPQPAGILMLDDAQATGTITNVDPLQMAWLARFGRAVATAAVDALGDRIERRAQARGGTGGTDTDLSLLQSFFLSGAGGSGAAGYGGYGGGPGQIGSGAAGHGMTGHGSAPGGTATGSRSGGVGSPASMVGQQHAGLGGIPMGGANGGMPMGGAPMRGRRLRAGRQVGRIRRADDVGLRHRARRRQPGGRGGGGEPRAGGARSLARCTSPAGATRRRSSWASVRTAATPRRDSDSRPASASCTPTRARPDGRRDAQPAGGPPGQPLRRVGLLRLRGRSLFAEPAEPRPLPSTGVTRLPRYCGPLRHPDRPDLTLAGCRLARATPPAGLPVLRPLPSSTRAVAITPAETVGAPVARFPTAGSLPRVEGGSASASQVSGPARRSLALRLR